MNPSSFNPSLHLVYSKIGIKGLNIFGTKQASLNLSEIFDLIVEILEAILEKRFETLEYIAVRGEILFCTRFNVSPTRMTGRGHECGCKLLSDCREVDAMFGSENNAAVAGIIRGIRNDPERLDEKTDNTVAPLIPPTRPPTSPATIEFWREICNNKLFLSTATKFICCESFFI